MIARVSATRPGVIPNIIRIQKSRGQISLPVHPIQSVYARFKHIRAVPSADGGVSVFKLRILDSIIDKLLNRKKIVPDIKEPLQVDFKNIDSLLNDLQKQLKASLVRSRPLFGGFYPETGLLVDLVA